MSRDASILAKQNFQQLLDVLSGNGFQIIGPQIDQGAIVFNPVQSVTELASNVKDQQAPGVYRLTTQTNQHYFDWSNGPQALKPLLFKPEETLWSAQQKEGQIQFNHELPNTQKTAVIGVRACDLAALALHDNHFLEGDYPDPFYRAYRESLLLIAVNCTSSADTCFCVSTGDGPAVTQTFDLLLTELPGEFIIEAGSDAGQQILQQLTLQPTTVVHHEQAERLVQQAADQQHRSLPSDNLKKFLFDRLTEPHWQAIADRCLSCGNCTAVCPTCFCYREVEKPELGGQVSHHVRQWDSCFTEQHSYMHGFIVRPETRFRYRQWMTHKLGSWHDQFGRSGCVGCGRCITWCPVGIDITEEVRRIGEHTKSA